MNKENQIKASTSIIVFIKNPRLGYVKTRLAKDIGDQKALDIYLRLTEHTRNVLSSVEGVTRYVYYSDFINEKDDWNEQVFEKRVQIEGNLGSKIKAAFMEVFQNSDKVIIIGSDCAQLTADHINSAIESLDNNNVVIGPTYDGGYYLLGMAANYPFLFEDIEWSTETVCEETKAKATNKNLKVGEIERLSDIDYIEDWEKYGLDS